MSTVISMNDQSSGSSMNLYGAYAQSPPIVTSNPRSLVSLEGRKGMKIEEGLVHKITAGLTHVHRFRNPG